MIAILLVTHIGLSQTSTESDTIKISNRVAKLIIKDLISGDACQNYLDLSTKIIVNQDQQITFYEAVMDNMATENGNLELIIGEKEKQIALTQMQVDIVEKDLKRQTKATTFYKITTAAALITAGVFLIK